VSALQLHDEALVGQVRQVLISTGLPPANLTLEITESALMEDPRGAAERLRTLKMLGVSVAIDDFGTGYSSLSYLRQFPVDVLKIDKVFVDDIGGGGGTLAEGIVGLARALGLDTVAEGIEDPAQGEQLAMMGCQYGQGYTYARPQPALALAEYLAQDADRASDAPAARSV
jgi:EAL domain-containing protein (putative c-di-GMP-specific phosphodiesterase class I)